MKSRVKKGEAKARIAAGLYTYDPVQPVATNSRERANGAGVKKISLA